MSTIKISELATSAISLTDFFAKADSAGLANKNTVQELSNFLNTVGTLAFRGVLLAADAAVTLDGVYVAGDAGTYTNNGGLVITVSNQIVLISITGTQTVFEKVEIPITLTIDAIPTVGSTNAVESGGVYTEFSNIKKEEFNNTYIDGFYIKFSSGVLTSNASYKASEFIDVLPNKEVLIYSQGNDGNAGYSCYDKDKNYIEGGTLPSVLGETIFTTSEQCLFVRFSIKNGSETYSFLTIDKQNITSSINVTNILNNSVIIDNAINLFSDTIYTDGFYVNNLGNILSNASYAVTDFVAINENQTYDIEGAISTTYVAYYDKDKVLISSEGSVSTSPYSLTTPFKAYYLRYSFFISLKPTANLKNTGGYYLKNKEPLKIDFTPTSYENSSLGSLDFEPLPISGYSNIAFYGQSLSTGNESESPITTTSLTDCFMIGSTPNDLTGSFNPLKSVFQASGDSGEQPVVSAVNSFKKRLNKTFFKDVKMVAISAGLGGRTIELLSKQCTNTVSGTTSDNLYNTRFIQSLNTANTNAGADGIVCNALVYMQGEANTPANTSNSSFGLTKTPVSYPTIDKDIYKAYLLTLKNNMQSDVKSIYGQSFNPLFYIYQTGYDYVFSDENPIAQAQYEFSQENSDVILLNPHYYCPTSAGGHLNSNGYRWFGQQVAKSLSDNLIDNKNSSAIKPKKFKVDRNYIYIDFQIPVKPLVIDLKTIEEQTNYGFFVKKDAVDVRVTDVKVINGSTIKLTVKDDVSSGVVNVGYASLDTNGRGNIRDSDEYISLYDYVDDSTLLTGVPPYTPVDENDVNYYGRKYPMFNWLCHFYVTI